MKPLYTLLITATLISPAFAKDKAGAVIIETRNEPVAITTFWPRNTHTVKAHWRLAFHRLKLTPFVAQSFDRENTVLGMNVTLGTTFESFNLASIVITADGKVLLSSEQNWTADASWGLGTHWTGIENAALLNKIAGAQEVYLTVFFPGRSAPFDKISFKLSEDQLGDCRLMSSKYAALLER
jgi:hypothetical protein